MKRYIVTARPTGQVKITTHVSATSPASAIAEAQFNLRIAGVQLSTPIIWKVVAAKI
ncbi:MAG TPA: hypothetical protein VM578_06990 [Candidatus Saccharimonadales bacterium]|nr:hypothetical protein [Candidatus Saccharimonadales bacterium]